MPDNRSKKKIDAKRISLRQPWERTYWTHKLGVSIGKLALAVANAGHSVERVRAYLRQQGK